MTDIARYIEACKQLGTTDPREVRRALQWDRARTANVLRHLEGKEEYAWVFAFRAKFDKNLEHGPSIHATQQQDGSWIVSLTETRMGRQFKAAISVGGPYGMPPDKWDFTFDILRARFSEGFVDALLVTLES